MTFNALFPSRFGPLWDHFGVSMLEKMPPCLRHVWTQIKLSNLFLEPMTPMILFLKMVNKMLLTCKIVFRIPKKYSWWFCFVFRLCDLSETPQQQWWMATAHQLLYPQGEGVVSLPHCSSRVWLVVFHRGALCAHPPHKHTFDMRNSGQQRQTFCSFLSHTQFLHLCTAIWPEVSRFLNFPPNYKRLN